MDPMIRSPLLAPAFFIGISSLALPSQAEQFTLMDVEFTFTKEDADNSTPSPSHYYVQSDSLTNQPADWTAPVDYRNGSVHIRTEVLDKPAGGEITQWSICYIPNVGIGAGYGCANSGTYTEAGIHERDESMTSWWQNDQLDWTRGINEMHLVIKDSDSGGGHAHKREDSENFFPTTIRMTLVQVSAGSTYDESMVEELGEAKASGGTDSGTATGGASSATPTANGNELEPTTPGPGGTNSGESERTASNSGGCTVAAAPSRNLPFGAAIMLLIYALRVCTRRQNRVS